MVNMAEADSGKGVTRRDFLKLATRGPMTLYAMYAASRLGVAEGAANNGEFLAGVGESFARLRGVLEQMPPERRRGVEGLRLTRAWLLFHGLQAVMMDHQRGLTARAMQQYVEGGGMFEATGPKVPERTSAELAVAGNIDNIISSAMAQAHSGEWLVFDQDPVVTEDRRVGWKAHKFDGVAERARESVQALPELYGDGRVFSHYFGMNEVGEVPPRVTEDMGFLLGKQGLWRIEFAEESGELCVHSAAYPASHLEVRLDSSKLVAVRFRGNFEARTNPFDGFEIESGEITASVRGLLANLDELAGGLDTSDVERAISVSGDDVVELCEKEGFLRQAYNPSEFAWGGWGSVIKEIGGWLNRRPTSMVSVDSGMFEALEEVGLAAPVLVTGRVVNDDNSFAKLALNSHDATIYRRYEWFEGVEPILPTPPSQSHG